MLPLWGSDAIFLELGDIANIFDKKKTALVIVNNSSDTAAECKGINFVTQKFNKALRNEFKKKYKYAMIFIDIKFDLLTVVSSKRV